MLLGGEVKPVHPESELASNVALLLARSAGGVILGSNFKQAYVAMFKKDLDLKGLKLVDLLARCEAAGACRLEKVPPRGRPDAPPLLSVFAARKGHRAASC